MYLYSINTYECIKNPHVVSILSIDNWLGQIKHSDYSEQILKARNGLLDYKQTKAKLPCVTYNFLYGGYKTDSNIITSSGLVYIDIDNPAFDISRLDLTKVYAYYKSFGGNGYAILVKASGLTKSNFHSTYASITSELGISGYVDKGAAKASQFNVLSYDEDIFINKASFTFTAVEVAPQSIVIQRERTAYTTERGAAYQSIRFDNLNEIEIPADYIVNWEGYEYIRCFMPIKKISKNRNNFLLSYCNNLVYLNDWISKEKTIEILNAVNKQACIEPVDYRHIERVVDSIHKYKEDGTLAPIYYWKKRKIVFDKTVKLTREDKLDICHKENAIHKTALSREKLYGILEGWDFGLHGCISQRKVYGNFAISKKTVEKYWKEFKDYVDNVNKVSMGMADLAF